MAGMETRRHKPTASSLSGGLGVGVLLFLPLEAWGP